MILPLEKPMRLGDVQSSFKRKYPFLKLEFFDRPQTRQNGNRPKLQPDFKMKALAGKETNEPLRIYPWTTVRTLKEQFFQLFGLYACVYRRRGYEWTETDRTEGLCLKDQNELGQKSIYEYRDSLQMEKEALL